MPKRRYPIHPRRKLLFDMKEVWRPFPGEDNYLISSRGRVKNKHTGLFKSIRFDRDGYRRVTLYPSGRTYRLGRITALVFLKRVKKERTQVNHINGVKDDDRTWNLEWCTPQENSAHRSIMNPINVKGINNPMSKLTEDAVRMIRHGLRRDLNNRQLGRLFGVGPEIIRNIRNGTAWPHIK